MGEIKNIYITHEYKEIDWNNRVFLRVINNGKTTFIESTKHGYVEINNNHWADDFSRMSEHIMNDTVFDLMKDCSKVYRIYANRLNKAIFVDVNTPATKIPFKQIVYIKNNAASGTKGIFGGAGASEPYFREYTPTNEIITKKELISGITKELKVCFPELKITLKDTNKNVNE